MVDQIADVREIMHPRQPRAEARIYREPRGAPEIGCMPLDLSIPLHPLHRGPVQPARPLPQHLDVPLYDDYYRVATGLRQPARPGPPIQHRLAKLDVFKGEIGERLDDFIYWVEEFAAFAWDPVETCRQARTHLRGVTLAYVQAPAPERLDRIKGSAYTKIST